jgi:hypothetical protein
MLCNACKAALIKSFAHSGKGTTKKIIVDAVARTLALVATQAQRLFGS